jgi:hypothetical protein
MAGERAAKPGPWRRARRWAVVPAALLLSVFALRTPEPARTAFALLAGVCNVRSPRTRELLLDSQVADRLTLQSEEQDPAWSRRELSRGDLLEQLQHFDRLHPSCQLELEVTAVHGAEGAEWLEGKLQFSESQAGDLHAEGRSVRALFETVGGQRRLERLLLFAPERSLPEARP